MVTEMMSSVLVEASPGPHGKPNLSAELSHILSSSLVQDACGCKILAVSLFACCVKIRIIMLPSLEFTKRRSVQEGGKCSEPH